MTEGGDRKTQRTNKEIGLGIHLSKALSGLALIRLEMEIVDISPVYATSSKTPM